MKDTLQFTIKTPDSILTIIRSDSDTIEAIISLEVSLPADTLAQLIALVKGRHPYVVTFTPQEEP